METVMFRLMTDDDAQAVSQLVTQVFDAAIAPLYDAAGVEAFHTYASPEAIRARSSEDHFVILAVSERNLVGVAEIRANSHLAMLFVAESFQRSGLGRELVSRAVATCAMNRPDLAQVTVHASPNSVAAYERFGFTPTGPEQDVNGIRFTPMALELRLEETEYLDFDLPL